MSLLHQSSPLEVTVTPAQSSFFAGEELRCLITFTNRNIPVPASQPLPSTSRFPGSLDASFSRDRRTISDADVATSTPPKGHVKSQSFDIRAAPGRNGKQRQSSSGVGITEEEDGESEAAIDYDLAGNALPTRKRTIGKHALPSGLSPAGKAASEKKHTKSASVAVLPNASAGPPPAQASNTRNKAAIGLGYPSASGSGQSGNTAAASRTIPGASDTGTSRGNGRRLSTSIQADHPHSRKKSVMQVQHEDLSAAFELSNGAQGPRLGKDGQSASVDDSALPGAYNMTPSQSRDTSYSGNAFYGLGRNDTMESVVRDQLTSWSHGGAPPSRRPSASNISASPRSPSGTGSSPLFPQPGTAAPGTETVLWSFAQFSGSYEVDESLIKPGEFEEVKRRLAFGDALSATGSSGTPRAIGGGDLGHEESADAAAAKGWAAYLRNALGGADGGQGPPSRHRRTGSTMLEVRQKTMASKTIPTFSSPPSIVAVDLNLLPGESKTYSFTMQLPTDLPPSYFGKAIKFTYELVIGTNRVDSRRVAAKAGNQRSRLIKIPLRIYNHVNIAGARAFFDLTNPVILLRDAAKVREEEIDLKSTEAKRRAEEMVKQMSNDSAQGVRRQEKGERSHRDLQLYARSLLASCEGGAEAADGVFTLESEMKKLIASPPQTLRQLDGKGPTNGGALPLRRNSSVSATGEEEAPESCKSAIEVLTRNSQKVSYDIAKDGSVAAVLTLVKSKYRLGDSILGVVNINRVGAVARVVRIAAVLESYEEVEASLGTMTAGRMQKATRKIHAEHHDSTLDAGQASFSLPIPSGATPDFSTSGVKLHWTVRLSFLTQVAEHTNKAAPRPLPPPHLHPSSEEDGFSLYHSRYRAVPRLSGALGPLFPAASPGGSQEEKGNGAGEEGKEAPRDTFGKDVKLEIVECAVAVAVLPNSTSFKPNPVSFAA